MLPFVALDMLKIGLTQKSVPRWTRSRDVQPDEHGDHVSIGLTFMITLLSRKSAVKVSLMAMAVVGLALDPQTVLAGGGATAGHGGSGGGSYAPGQPPAGGGDITITAITNGTKTSHVPLHDKLGEDHRDNRGEVDRVYLDK